MGKMKTLDYLVGRFCQPWVAVDDFKGLLKLEINSLKMVDEYINKALERIYITKIKNHINKNIKKLEKKLNKTSLDKSDIDSVLIFSKLLKKFKEGTISLQEIQPVKIAFMGMQNAGKTSLVNYLFGETVDDQYQETSPTVSVAQQVNNMEGNRVVIWDFGGQESFRNEYLDKPEDFLNDIEVLLFVIDSQDDSLYAGALEYFDSLLAILNNLQINTSIMIDFHKFDPDVSNNFDFIVKVEWLEEKLREVINNYRFNYEFIRSSIFADISNDDEPEIMKDLKNILTARSSDYTTPSELELLKKILYFQTKMYINTINNLNLLQKSNNRLEKRLLDLVLMSGQSRDNKTTLPLMVKKAKESANLVDQPANKISVVAELKKTVDQIMERRRKRKRINESKKKPFM